MVETTTEDSGNPINNLCNIFFVSHYIVVEKVMIKLGLMTILYNQRVGVWIK